MIKMDFGNKKIEKDSPVFIIAEVSANHLQDYEIAEKIVRKACEAGADAIKLQTYTPDTMSMDTSGVKEEIINKYLIVNINNPAWKGITYYDLYKKAYMPWEWHEKLRDIADEYDVPIFSTPFDVSAVDFLEKINFNPYKISSFDVVNIPLLKRIAETRKPVIMSTGMASLEELELAYNTLKENGCPEISLLHCISSYPAKYGELNLSKLFDLKKKFNCVVGFSDHSLTTDAPAMAVVLGAKIIEKHITLDRNLGGPDSSFSLEPSEFKELVKKVRQVEKQKLEIDLGELEKEFSYIRQALGTPFYGPQGIIEKQTSNARPSIWVSDNIQDGELFTKQNLKVVRPGAGISPKYFEKILGKKAERNFSKGEPLNLDIVKNEI